MSSYPKMGVMCTKCGKHMESLTDEHICSDGILHSGIHFNVGNITGETDIENKKLREALWQIAERGADEKDVEIALKALEQL